VHIDRRGGVHHREDLNTVEGTDLNVVLSRVPERLQEIVQKWKILKRRGATNVFRGGKVGRASVGQVPRN